MPSADDTRTTNGFNLPLARRRLSLSDTLGVRMPFNNDSGTFSVGDCLVSTTGNQQCNAGQQHQQREEGHFDLAVELARTSPILQHYLPLITT